MKQITNNAELIAAIDTLLEYNWRDEEQDYEQHEGDKDAHIFTTMQALDAWIKGTM